MFRFKILGVVEGWSVLLLWCWWWWSLYTGVEIVHNRLLLHNTAGPDIIMNVWFSWRVLGCSCWCSHGYEVKWTCNRVDCCSRCFPLKSLTSQHACDTFFHNLSGKNRTTWQPKWICARKSWKEFGIPERTQQQCKLYQKKKKHDGKDVKPVTWNISFHRKKQRGRLRGIRFPLRQRRWSPVWVARRPVGH